MSNWLLKTKAGVLLKNAAGVLVRTCTLYFNPGYACCNCAAYPPLHVTITFWGITACPGQRGDYLNGKRFVLDFVETSCDAGGDFWCHYKYSDSDVDIFVGFEGTVSAQVLVNAQVYEPDISTWEGAFDSGYIPGCPGFTCYDTWPNQSVICNMATNGTGGYASWRPAIFSIWLLGEAYVIDDVVRNDQVFYQCHQAHTATAPTEPGTGANWQDYWDEIPICPTPAAWVTGHAYNKYEWVRNGGSNYVCTAGHTSGASTEPGVGVDWALKWDVLP